MNSYPILKRVLLQRTSTNGEVLANVISKEFKLDIEWSKRPDLYPFPDDPKKNSPQQDSLLRDLIATYSGKQFLSVSKPSKDQFFYGITVKCENQIIASCLPKFLVKQTSDLYTELKTKKSRKTLEMLQNEVDSLNRSLGNSIAANVSKLDETFNINPALQSQRKSIQKNQVTLTALSAAYAEVVRNFEIAKINLMRDTPLYQIIDEPQQPLRIEMPSKMIVYKMAILFFVVTNFVLLVYNELKNISKV